MTCDWSNINVKCPTCHKHGVIQFVQVSADGELNFVAYCAACAILIQWRVFASQLAHLALMNDLKVNQPKPLALPTPLYTADDQQFFRDNGIQGEDRAA